MPVKKQAQQDLKFNGGVSTSTKTSTSTIVSTPKKPGNPDFKTGFGGGPIIAK